MQTKFYFCIKIVFFVSDNRQLQKLRSSFYQNLTEDMLKKQTLL